MRSPTTRVQAIKPLPWAASLPVIWPLVLERQQTFEYHASVPPHLSAEGKVPRYSPRLSEVVLAHDRRANASLGALPNMLLSPRAFASRWGG